MSINLKTDHTSDLDNFLWISNSIINSFWPPDPSDPPTDGHLQGLVENHGTKKDVGAFFYTFSILLRVATEEAIRERKEEVRDATSSMLRILEEDTELVANATRKWVQNVLLLVEIHCRDEPVAERVARTLAKLHNFIEGENLKCHECIIHMIEVCASQPALFWLC